MVTNFQDLDEGASSCPVNQDYESTSDNYGPPQRPQKTPPLKRKKPTNMAEEAYQAMKKISNTLEQHNDDQFDVFGRYVANELRNLGDQRLQTEGKFKINELLYNLALKSLPPHPGYSSTPGSSMFDDSSSTNCEDLFTGVVMKF